MQALALFQTVCTAQIHGGANAALCRHNRKRGHTGDSFGKGICPRTHVVGRIFEIIGKPVIMQPLDRHQITGQNNFHENGLWQHRQRRSRPRRPAPDLHFGNAHLGAFEADPKIAVQCQHHTTGHQGSGHGSDDRLFASAHGFVKRIAHLAQDIDALVPRDLGCFLEVQSGAEHTAIGRCQNGYPDGVIRFDFLPGIGQTVRRGDGQCILALGPVDTDGRNAVFNCHFDWAHDNCFVSLASA